MTNAAPAPPPEAEDRSVSMAQANVWALVILLPVMAALIGAFWWRYDGLTLWAGVLWWMREPGWFFLALIGGVVVHEGLHGLAWWLAGRPSPDAIRFGFQWKTLTPYAHCTEPMAARAYRIGAATPGVALGLLPCAVGLWTGNAAWFTFGLFFTLAAGGDALILWLLRGVAPDRLVEDHPSRAGCYVLP